ncbi:LuxR C-terminal-related transcriptional regulator [Salmonella enterica]|uniref:LuxR C-terminal-related transcriptional regulator n=1 Tax=Salmonella enterica TaxID=28901 RepID=UPI00107BCC6F|nr:LuxR C-terminal-related transcriptional regulator [Salmonella enterica]EAA3133797.1 DNA-binding response regulator [Salmonella enterica subsp. enterica serovar Chester]EGE9388782.1 DNA-binding response regulator [Salmonella enterica subsp. enterica serovar Bredeney]EGL8376476.1 DNA-binding response regulator [Salmonella enterica]EIT1501234.1 DNA-binding response regulator [Salmonella enterica]EJO2520684.1 DNA-binding response regulator [Salmonella enterica]
MLDIKNEYFTLSVDLRRSALTPAEKEVLRLLLAGYDMTTIGQLKSRSFKTVSTQKLSAYKKLGIRSDVALFPGLIERWGMQVACAAEAPQLPAVIQAVK